MLVRKSHRLRRGKPCCASPVGRAPKAWRLLCFCPRETAGVIERQTLRQICLGYLYLFEQAFRYQPSVWNAASNSFGADIISAYFDLPARRPPCGFVGLYRSSEETWPPLKLCRHLCYRKAFPNAEFACFCPSYLPGIRSFGGCWFPYSRHGNLLWGLYIIRRGEGIMELPDRRARIEPSQGCREGS